MDKLAQNIQEAFLNNARKEKTFLTIYLMSGVKLSGRIKSFDKYSVILETNNQEQLIFKHAISTVVVSKPIPRSPQHILGRVPLHLALPYRRSPGKLTLTRAGCEDLSHRMNGKLIKNERSSWEWN